MVEEFGQFDKRKFSLSQGERKFKVLPAEGLAERMSGEVEGENVNLDGPALIGLLLVDDELVVLVE